MTVKQDLVDSNNPTRAKLQWLILGRMATALLLFILGSLWNRSSGAQQSIRKSLILFCIVICITIVYSFILRLSTKFLLQARVQIAIDVLLITWLVWNSEVVHSPYIALYIVVIAVSSLFLGPRDAVVTSVGCALTFTLSAMATTGWGQAGRSPLVGDSISQTVEAVGLFDISFLVVGLLSARLAERQSRSDVRLLAARQSLASLRALHERIVASIRSGVVTTDLEGRIYTFNQAAEEITGYSEEDLRGQDASIFFGEMKDQVTDSLEAAEKGLPSPRFETDCLTSEGLRLRLGFSLSPLFSESGQTTGMVITFQDLTQVRALEESSRRQDRLAAIGRMAASIAHEIRNPLAAMRGSIQMLRSEMGANSSQTELMEIILRESDRLNRIITDFLSYARPRSITQSRVDVGELVHRTFALLRHSPEIIDGQEIIEELPTEAAYAEADSGQLQQVFWNLARNALQAMPRGGTLRASLKTNSNNRLRITFTDTGRGMSPDQVERLFEPFSSTTGGTGLGLSIVYQIIRDHGGTINVRSREGQGTTISIELPAATEENKSELAATNS